MTNVFERWRPTSREWTGGEFPVKSYRAQNGAELKILYGDKIVKRSLKLTYNNLKDEVVADFLDHYISNQGTYKKFIFSSKIIDGVLAGWTGGLSVFNRDGSADENRVKWSYANEPIVTSVARGLSTLQIELIASA